MPMPSEQEMRDAVAERDESYNGRFVYGVITTGVFCKPSCPSRAANAENLRFFSQISMAVESGFRPCKRCNPSQTTSGTEEQLIQLARYIEEHVEEKLTLTTLGKIAGLSASRLQRVFKANFGVSPKVYQDAIRA